MYKRAAQHWYVSSTTIYTPHHSCIHQYNAGRKCKVCNHLILAVYFVALNNTIKRETFSFDVKTDSTRFGVKYACVGRSVTETNVSLTKYYSTSFHNGNLYRRYQDKRRLYSLLSLAGYLNLWRRRHFNDNNKWRAPIRTVIFKSVKFVGWLWYFFTTNTCHESW